MRLQISKQHPFIIIMDVRAYEERGSIQGHREEKDVQTIVGRGEGCGIGNGLDSQRGVGNSLDRERVDD